MMSEEVAVAVADDSAAAAVVAVDEAEVDLELYGDGVFAVSPFSPPKICRLTRSL